MTYTPNTWATGDTITAAKLNNMEDGIANAGSGWDAIIRLTHGDNSGLDTTANLTPSIVSGTYASLVAKMQGGGCPTILVEYVHPWGNRFAAPMIGGILVNPSSLYVKIAGYFPSTDDWQAFGLRWDSNDTLSWAT